MAPNVSTNEIDNSYPQETSKSRQELFYNGYFYDVTDFVDRHPGGNIIKFYTVHGEDATQAIEQFHYRSRNKVEAIMKSFKRRPAELQDLFRLSDKSQVIDSKIPVGMDPAALARHKALNADFKKLFEELEAEGYFEPSIPHVIIRLLEGVALPVLALAIFYECQTIFTKFLATIFCGFAMSRLGWMMHEGGHNSLTGWTKVDKFLQHFGNSFMLGGSALWWNSQHNRHHAMPQRLEHDVDLATLPYVAFHKRTVKNSDEINSFFVRYQAVFYWTLDLLVIVIAWKCIIHPRYQLHKKAYYELALGIPTILLAIFGIGPVWYFTISYWFAFFLGINFALSHSHLDVADKPTHWIEYSLTHTANIQPSIFVDYFMGYLNYQIEHHLFPTMPQFRQKEICHRVKALAEKYGLPYRVYSYTEACALAVKNLNDVGRELTSNEYFNKKH